MTNTKHLQTIKAAVDALLQPHGKVASLDMYLLDDFLVIPLARPKTVDGKCWRTDTTIDIVDLWQLETEEANQ